MTDLVSIITPTFNCGEYIGETIESVCNQTYKKWEMIIVDDCSTDNTSKVVEKYLKDDSRIKYYRLTRNSGAAIARTKAIDLSTGNFIAFLDSDDLWSPDKLEKQLTFMKENNIPFSCTSYEQISDSGRLLDRTVTTIPRIDYNRILLDCPVGNSTVMYNVEILGKFEVPNIPKGNDDALWLKMLKKTEYIYGLDEVLMQYRVRSGSLSRNKFKVIKYHWILYRKIEKLSIARSLFHIGYWGIIKVFRLK
ncbi:glycosyltransferase family 2 protein [Streptococcus massiliensis]|uniref:Family 2 glycosyl transferase n=1 Tax=Streptococcus massiliensis TaxID=313439 RepID=A0A380KZC9_9STRE|nr:glycosyltransferase family 2 protein [Streptococcus massiliensis]SUN76467.1 family 2 glycosyl transferase [Streptococcus massiliensis]